MKKQIILTGDRPSGLFHLGHYIGTFKNRVELQDEFDQYILIADTQALTDKPDRKEVLKEHIIQAVIDYLSVGIDENKSTIFIQSYIKELFELTSYFLNLVSVSRLMRNPTIKNEIKMRNFQETIPAGFLMYPVSQAADILLFDADLVPVGEDQLPLIEQTNEIGRSFNYMYTSDTFKDTKPLISKCGRLVGIDGKDKMSKSLNNAIFLSDDEKTVSEKVMKMYTDASHTHIHLPGKIEGNVVFTYLDIFDSDIEKVQELKNQYQKGGLGDVVLKKRLSLILNDFLDPFRKKRKILEQNRDHIISILKKGTERAQEKAEKKIEDIRKIMGVDFFNVLNV